MEELMIKQLWQDYELKLENSLQLNYTLLREMQTLKIKDNLSGFKRTQILGIAIGVVWLYFLVSRIEHTSNNVYFLGSVGFIAFFNIFAIAAYIRHLALLETVNLSDNITSAQKKLAVIQSSVNNVGRIMLLQTPFYCTINYSPQIIEHGSSIFWMVNIPVLLILTALSVYLFKTLTYKNIHRAWVRKFIEGFGGKKLTKAMEFLNEVEAYQKG